MSATDTLGTALLVRARNAVAAALAAPTLDAPDHPQLAEPGATFVTLFTQGSLRGCVGSLEPVLPLADDVQSNARAAAFRDPRFSPLMRRELAFTRFEVSLIGPASPVGPASTESAAIALIEPALDGITLHWHGRRATLLPQVWASLPDPRDFLRALKQKAGLPGDFWSADIRLDRYRVVHYEEAEVVA